MSNIAFEGIHSHACMHGQIWYYVKNFKFYFRLSNLRHSCPVRLQAKEALKNIESIDGKFICPNCNKFFDLMIKLKNHYMEIHVNNSSPKKNTVKEEIKEEQQPMFRYVFNNFLC